MTHQIPTEVASDIGPLLARLAELGYHPTGGSYSPESFGNYYVDLTKGKNWLRIVRERSQYFIDTTSKEQLRTSGMFRAFNDRDSFEQALLQWLRAA